MWLGEWRRRIARRSQPPSLDGFDARRVSPERPEGTPLTLQPVLAVNEAATFTPPSSGTVVRPVEAQHWDALELVLADPGGRHLSVQAPLPALNEEKQHGVGRRSPLDCACSRSTNPRRKRGSNSASPISSSGCRTQSLRCLPVDFERGEAWLARLTASGFDAKQPAVVASTGVSMYLTKDAILATLREVASLSPARRW